MQAKDSIECLVYRSPFRLKKAWDRLYANGYYTPFQAWRLNWVWSLVYGLKGARRKYKPLFYYFQDTENTENECIIPVLVDKKRRLLANYSQFGPIDYYDAICSTRDGEFLRRCMSELMKEYKGYSLNFENVNESSALCQVLMECDRTEAPCVRIKFQSADYDVYNQSLSKHQSLNLRTRYNKLQRLGLPFNVVKYDAQNKIPRSVHRKCMKMYEVRCAMKNGYKSGPLSKLAAYRDRVTNLIDLLAMDDGNAVFVAFVNGIPAGYMVCFYDLHRPIVYVPRLTVNADFMCYGAGILMLNETIKILLKEGIGILDLTRGDEPYKFSMGGTVHYNYTFRKTI